MQCRFKLHATQSIAWTAGRSEGHTPTATTWGAVGILTGNWGGHRANAATQAAVDLDLKSGPATIICLQEAHEGVADVLAEPAPPPPPAVAGNGGEDRPQAQYYTLRANENCNTNFIAVRVNLASELKSVRFQRTVDGFCKAKNGGRVAAVSRMQIAQVTWNNQWQGWQPLLW